MSLLNQEMHEVGVKEERKEEGRKGEREDVRQTKKGTELQLTSLLQSEICVWYEKFKRNNLINW